MIEKIIISITLILIILLIVIAFCVYNKYSKFVIRNSERLRKLSELNSKTTFNIIDKKQYYFHQSCNTKRQFDILNLEDYFIVLIEDEIDYFTNIYNPILQNKDNYEKYITKCNNIKTEATNDFCKQIKTTLKKFTARENKIFLKQQILPTLDININLKATYTSPAGRNSYAKSIDYDFDEFENLYHKTKDLINQKKTRQYQIKIERAKLGDSLRYDVLKRDNFKCQICGSSAYDGVKLHVDHIVPVSKGGKTTLDNLRTLCDRCNIGKRDKIE